MPRHYCLQSKRFSGYPSQPACYIRHAAGTHELQLYGIDGQNHRSPCRKQELVVAATMHPSPSAINCCTMAGIDSFREWLHCPALPAAKNEPLLKNSHDSTFPGKTKHGSQPKTATLTDAIATRRVRHPKTATQTGHPANPSTHRIRIRLRCRPLSEAKYGSRSEMAVAAGTDRYAGTQHHAMRYDSAYDTKAPRP